jgi:hypothetical protein
VRCGVSDFSPSDITVPLPSITQLSENASRIVCTTVPARCECAGSVFVLTHDTSLRSIGKSGDGVAPKRVLQQLTFVANGLDTRVGANPIFVESPVLSALRPRKKQQRQNENAED